MEERGAKIMEFCCIGFLVTLIIICRLVLQESKSFFLILGAGVAAILGVISCFIIRRRLHGTRKLLESRLVSEGRELRIEYSFLRKVAGVPIKFRQKELEEATSNFQTLIGRGASAEVFRGVLPDGTPVAVKRIGEERGEKDFRSEVAAIASVQHLNLVRLIGYSSVPRSLVYDFIPNGSLDKWIFPNNTNNCLSWEMRCNVALDVAKALCYLHHDCRSRILHLDVKPENILLDHNYRALVSDFGLSKIMGKDQSRVITTIRGTKGYLAPEWLLGFGVSEKSDIYSFGMVLLEIIGGRRNVTVVEDNTNDRSNKKFEYFPKIVTQKLRQGSLMELVDQRVVEEIGIDDREVKRLVMVALWCIQEKARLRPTMARVVQMLEGRLPVDHPPETRMIIVDLLCIDDDEENPVLPGHHRRLAKMVATPHLQHQDDSILPSSARFSFSYSMLTGR